MLKKNTRKRLLAGALATVMMLTMCPSWALADDEDIATLPAVEETTPVVDSAPAADPIVTPDVPSSSETEAPAEDQNTAPAPSDDGANGGTDVAESGNSTNSTVSEDSENNSQNNDAVSNAPENEIASQDAPSHDAEVAPAYLLSDVTKTAECWVTNRHAADSDGNWKTTITNAVGDGADVTTLAAPTIEAGNETYVFWQARVLPIGQHQSNILNGDRTKDGTEIDRIRYVEAIWTSDYFEYREKDTDFWKKFKTDDQLVFYYLVRTDYSKMVQIDVSDWTVNEEPSYDDRRSVTYQIIVDGGVDDGKVLDSKKFWYNKAFKVSSIRVRKIGDHPNYSIDHVVLEPSTLGDPTKNENGEYRFSLDLNQIKAKHNATVNIYVTPNVEPHQLTYFLNDGEITSKAGTYTPAGSVYPDASVITPTVEKADCTFGGWYINETLTQEWTGTTMPDANLTLYAKWVPNDFKVSYFYQNEQDVETQFGDIDTYAFGTDVTVRTAHPEKEGYTFTGWTSKDSAFDIRGFKMPARNVVIEGKFEKNPAKQYTYTVNKHFYNEKGVEVNVVKGEATPAAENTAVSDLYKVDAKNQTVDGKTYVYVSGLTTVTDNLEKLTKDVTIDLYYYLNVEGGNDIPDAWEYRLTFKVVNGEWNDGGNADIVTYVQFKDQKTGEAFKDEAVVVPVTRIPAVGDKPNSGYHAGAWDTSPYDNYKVQKDTVFTYTYAKNSSGGSSGGHHRRPTVTIPDDVPTGLNGDDHYAYIVGYPDKTVRPQNGITRAEVATIFFRLLTDETRNANSTKSNSYSDVAAGAWYNHAVSTLSAMGIVKGDSHGKFNPNAPITRAEFAAIAARFDDKANTTTADFSDIASHWAKNEISAASNNGWITGYPDGTFRPDNKITRAEAMTLVNRVLKRLPETEEDLHDDMIKWSDNSDVSQWFYLDVQEATNSHYYQTKENQFEKWTKLRETRDWTELEK